MRAAAGARQWYAVKDPAAFDEAIYKRAVVVARNLSCVSVHTLSLALHGGKPEVGRIIERMVREGLLSEPDIRGRRRML